MHLALLLSNAAGSLYMAGLCAFVHRVHYPLAAQVGPAEFQRYQALHLELTGLAVGPAMLLELAATLGLLVFRPAGVPLWMPWLGAALLALVWATTWFGVVPVHDQLAAGADPELLSKLVSKNLPRTLAWLARGALALAMITVAWQAR
ncbi:MAG: hypothetical protein ACI9VR_000895 [Cognaticolwellia sp.]|jgi:hypothetical protein